MSAIDEIMRAIEDYSEYSHALGCEGGSKWQNLCEDAPPRIRDLIAAAIADARRDGAIEAQQRIFPCCGGSDESPAKHCMDCETRVLPTGPRQAVRLTDEQLAWARLGPLIDRHQIGISTPRNQVHRNGGPNAGWGDSGCWGGTAWAHGLERRPAVSGKSSALDVVTELAAVLAANGMGGGND